MHVAEQQKKQTNKQTKTPTLPSYKELWLITLHCTSFMVHNIYYSLQQTRSENSKDITTIRDTCFCDHNYPCRTYAFDSRNCKTTVAVNWTVLFTEAPLNYWRNNRQSHLTTVIPSQRSNLSHTHAPSLTYTERKDPPRMHKFHQSKFNTQTHRLELSKSTKI